MKALRVLEHGKLPVYRDIERPDPAPDEVQVRIAATGLNFSDLLLIKGTYQQTPPPPFTLGMECAGTVTKVGANAGCLAPGDRVAVYSGFGGLAEFGCFPAVACHKIPPSMTFEQGAGFQIVFGTSHLALCVKANLQPDETVVVLGAAGGVGLTAVQIAKACGARVIAVARGDDRLQVARDAGADHLLDSDKHDLRQEIKNLGGADVVYDAVGGAQGLHAFRALKPFGRFLIIGFASGDIPAIPLNIALVKNIQIIGFNWGAFTGTGQQAASFQDLVDMFQAKKITPVIGQTVPFGQALSALEMLRERKVTGKIVVTMP